MKTPNISPFFVTYIAVWVSFCLVAACILIGACSAPINKPENPAGAVDSERIPVPKLTDWVNDTVGVLSTEDKKRLSNMLRDYEKETKHQFAVLIVPTLGDETIDSFCLRTANTWHLGRKGIDDGILICMAMQQRLVRIELGLGMERYISNADAKEIIETDMGPSFSKGDFAGGLERGLDRLMEEGRRFVVR
jgi:uncharacterized protein